MVLEIYDLIYIILSFADDESLFKLAYLNQKFNKILLKDQSIRGKSFQIRILNYKLQTSYKNIDIIVKKL